eukprot:239278-Amphidinium_carterae.2
MALCLQFCFMGPSAMATTTRNQTCDTWPTRGAKPIEHGVVHYPPSPRFLNLLESAAIRLPADSLFLF